MSFLLTPSIPFSIVLPTHLGAHFSSALVYLKTQGVSPANHPVKAELDRVRLYVKKIKVLSGERPGPGADAARRFVLHSLDRETREAAKEKEKETRKENDGEKQSAEDEAQRKRRQDRGAEKAPEGKRPR